MFETISIDGLLLLLLLMFGETPSKPKFIKQFTNNFPVYRWVIFFLLISKRPDGIAYFLIFFIIYQTFYIFDVINSQKNNTTV